MFKRSVATIVQYLFPQRTTREPRSEKSDAVRTARRNFFKKTAIGAVSVTGTAGLVKVVVDSTPRPDFQDRYSRDAVTGEQELREREYVLMSDQEKADMVQGFVDDYSNRG